MKITVEFTDPCLNDFIMEGPNADYVIRDGYLIITSDKFSKFPEKRVIFPMVEIFSVTEKNEG